MKSATLNEMVSEGACLVTALRAGETMTILDDGRAVALLIGLAQNVGVKRPIGCYAGQIHLREDFNAPLLEFDEAIEAPI
jgi:antitoxin (DNA-binding transcriptional repressor) of toxin-antitoxin stability system